MAGMKRILKRPTRVTKTDKQIVGEKAAEYIEDGMVVGLGTGSTAECCLGALAPRIKAGLKIKGVPTSERTAELARAINIPIVALDDVDAIDVTVDGADEIDPSLRLIKGGGGALLREKIVAAASRKIITIADSSKYVETLGAFPLPVEIVDFAARLAQREITECARSAGCQSADANVRVKSDGTPFMTDGGHLIVDIACGAIPDPEHLAASLNALPSVVDHGLFIGLSTLAILSRNGEIEIIQP